MAFRQNTGRRFHSGTQFRNKRFFNRLFGPLSVGTASSNGPTFVQAANAFASGNVTSISMTNPTGTNNMVVVILIGGSSTISNCYDNVGGSGSQYTQLPFNLGVGGNNAHILVAYRVIAGGGVTTITVGGNSSIWCGYAIELTGQSATPYTTGEIANQNYAGTTTPKTSAAFAPASNGSYVIAIVSNNTAGFPTDETFNGSGTLGGTFIQPDAPAATGTSGSSSKLQDRGNNDASAIVTLNGIAANTTCVEAWGASNISWNTTILAFH